MKIKVEFLYDRSKDKTSIYIWKGQTILDTKILKGTTNHDEKAVITKQMEKEFKDR